MVFFLIGLSRSVLVIKPISLFSLSTTISERYSDSSICFLRLEMEVYRLTVGPSAHIIASTGTDMVIKCTVAKA